MRSSTETWPRRPWRSLSGIMTLANPMISSVRNTREMLFSRVPVLGRYGYKNHSPLVHGTSDCTRDKRRAQRGKGPWEGLTAIGGGLE